MKTSDFCFAASSGINAPDRKAFARKVACWWPGGAELGKKSLKSNPRYVIEFYKRVLSEKSCVQVLAVNELPFGCKGGQAPKVIWEIFCSDPERGALEVTRGMPVTVLYVRFRKEYSRAHMANHISVRHIHTAFCRFAFCRGSVEHVRFCCTWARKLALLRLYFIHWLGRGI